MVAAKCIGAGCPVTEVRARLDDGGRGRPMAAGTGKDGIDDRPVEVECKVCSDVLVGIGNSKAPTLMLGERNGRSGGPDRVLPTGVQLVWSLCW